jgi:hypothetical protein
MSDHVPHDRMVTIVENIDTIARIRERIAFIQILEEEINHATTQLELDLLKRIKGAVDHRMTHGLK